MYFLLKMILFPFTAKERHLRCGEPCEQAVARPAKRGVAERHLSAAVGSCWQFLSSSRCPGFSVIVSPSIEADSATFEVLEGWRKWAGPLAFHLEAEGERGPCHSTRAKEKKEKQKQRRKIVLLCFIYSAFRCEGEWKEITWAIPHDQFRKT